MSQDVTRRAEVEFLVQVAPGIGLQASGMPMT